MNISEINTAVYSTIQETQLKYWEKIRHPFVAGLELTPFCNMKCIHCYMKGQSYSELLPTEDWKRIIDRLYENGVLILYMTGGEILTRKDFSEIYIYAKQRGFIIELLTNATELTSEILSIFEKYPPAIVSISIYGMTEKVYESVTGVKGSFFKFINSMKKLKEADIDLELKFIGLKENISDFNLARCFAEEIGAKFKVNFEIFPTLHGNYSVMQHRLSNEEIIEIEKHTPSLAKVWVSNIKDSNPFINKDCVPLYSCNIASTLLYIDYQGFINPCNKMRIKTHNILRKNLKETWEYFISKYAKEIAPIDYKCSKCLDIHICSPCPVVNKLSTGDYTKPDILYCQLAKMRKQEFSKTKYDSYR